MMSKRILLLFFIIFKCYLLFGQGLNPPGDWSITSDYGPRNVETSWFHYGIDYGGREGKTTK